MFRSITFSAENPTLLLEVIPEELRAALETAIAEGGSKCVLGRANGFRWRFVPESDVDTLVVELPDRPLTLAEVKKIERDTGVKTINGLHFWARAAVSG